MLERKNLFLRYMVIVSVFCLVCVIYLGRLFYIQISGRENTYNTGTTTRTVTVQAARGEIYDRNGKPLVTNRFSYDLTLSYATFTSAGLKNANLAALRLFEAAEASGESDKHVEKFFPFDGVYPYYVLSEAAEDADSIPYYRMRKVLKAIGLKDDASISAIVKYYVSTYDLLATDTDGKRLFDDDEIDRLIRLRYDMDAQGFKSNGEYVFAKNVALPMITYIKELSLPGITFTVNAERVYNYPGYASHILGTVGPIYSEEWDYYNEQGYQMNAIVGKSGCELAFEEYLRGIDGVLLIEEDASGNLVSVTVKKEAVAGSDVHLTIDIDLQIAAEDGLRENVDYVVNRANGDESRGANSNAGAAVAMDPNTFDILAIASYPTYDLSSYNTNYNDLVIADGNPLFNRALNGLYAPGSTYKLGVSVAALMEHKIASSSTISCTGVYHFFDYHPKCSTYPHVSSAINVIQAIADSCNSFFYEVGYRLGIDKMNEYMRSFGFGQSTGIELGGKTGVLASPEYRQESGGEVWTDGLTLQAAIGQADNLVSPLQLACYVSTLANGGTRYSAHLLDSVYTFGMSEPTFSYEQTDETLLSSIDIPQGVMDTVFRGMRDVVSGNATVKGLLPKGLPVTVGGKTGTAQNSSGCDNALFVAAAPYDTPDIVIAVVIEQGYTGSYAAYTAGKILDAFYN